MREGGGEEEGKGGGGGGRERERQREGQTERDEYESMRVRDCMPHMPASYVFIYQAYILHLCIHEPYYARGFCNNICLPYVYLCVCVRVCVCVCARARARVYTHTHSYTNR